MSTDQQETETRELGDWLATGAAFRLIESALRDPHQHCPRIMDFPRGTRQLEPMERWQTRALMSALRRSAAASLPTGGGRRPGWEPRELTGLEVREEDDPVLRGVPQATIDDCLPACIATLLGVELESVPVVDFSHDTWTEPYSAALRDALGYDLLVLGTDAAPRGEWIAVLPSLNQEAPHAVVMRGAEIVWDPSTRKRYPLSTPPSGQVRACLVLVPVSYCAAPSTGDGERGRCDIEAAKRELIRRTYGEGEAGLSGWSAKSRDIYVGAIEEACGALEHVIAAALAASPSTGGSARARSEAARMLAEFEAHPNSRPTSLALELTLHREEHAELQRELELGEDALDRAHLARELADVTYLAYRSAHVHGIDLDAALREVHRAAMDKIEANIRRSDGKIIKPPGFVPPDMTAALDPAAPSSSSGESGGEVYAADAELVVAHVAALPHEALRELARGPMPDGEATGCRVCAVLKDVEFATGSYRGGGRAAPDWLLNWHGSNPVKCGVIYGAAMAIVASAFWVLRPPSASDGDRDVTAGESAVAHDPAWTDDDGEPLGGWVQVDADECSFCGAVHPPHMRLCPSSGHTRPTSGESGGGEGVGA